MLLAHWLVTHLLTRVDFVSRPTTCSASCGAVIAAVFVFRGAALSAAGSSGMIPGLNVRGTQWRGSWSGPWPPAWTPACGEVPARTSGVLCGAWARPAP